MTSKERSSTAAEQHARTATSTSSPGVTELVRRVEEARREGRIDTDVVVAVEPRTSEELDELNSLAQDFLRSKTRGERSVSVTIRMRPEMVDALRLEAHRQGERGYQTLLKRWIDERLNNVHQNMISYAEVARFLEPFRRILEIENADREGPLETYPVETLRADERLGTASSHREMTVGDD